jgi:branched-chain amino acid transport system substrate-binding protein
MRKPFHISAKLLGCTCLVAILTGATRVGAQQEGPPVPYASIASSGVSYDGPGRESVFDLAGPTIHIGLLAPIHGPRKADGEAVIRAAQMALRDVDRSPLPGGRHLVLDVADESVPPWGLLGDEIIRLIVQQKAIAIVTCADGTAAHLSEQIGNKIGVPTLTLSSDPTTTQINMPWIFRLGPSDSQQAEVMAWNIYRVRGFRQVLLVTGNDHDGRVGGREFTEAAHRLGAPNPASLVINSLQPDPNSLVALIKAKAPQVIVFWTQPENAGKLIHAIRNEGFYTPIYLSQETAQEGSGLKFPRHSTGEQNDPAGVDIYSIDSRQSETPAWESFANRYRLATGTSPSPVAAEAYDAVRLVAQAVREAGPNRARVRDRVSRIYNLVGVSGTITFDDQGNNRAKVRLVRLR